MWHCFSSLDWNALPFARPGLLALAAALPVLLLLGHLGNRGRQRALNRFGNIALVAGLSTLNRSRRRLGRFCWYVGVLLLIVVVAGPRWGKGESSITEGRDLVVVLDLSKSMLTADMRDAETPERWQATQAGIREMVGRIRQRGGHRLGLVVFAAKAWTVCPLTADYDHFLSRLEEFTPTAPPPETQPLEAETFRSGTRIGTGIREGLRNQDERFPGYQDLLLISDGDDPAPDRDGEIAWGIEAARTAQIPVHVVGVGDPDHASPFLVRRATGEDLGGPSQLHETPLRNIARSTNGEYLAARRETPALGDFFETRIASRPSRELPDDTLPQPREQYRWFLIAGLLFLLAAWRWDT